jgi:hypothetical protein
MKMALPNTGSALPSTMTALQAENNFSANQILAPTTTVPSLSATGTYNIILQATGMVLQDKEYNFRRLY